MPPSPAELDYPSEGRHAVPGRWRRWASSLIVLLFAVGIGGGVLLIAGWIWFQRGFRLPP